MASDENRLAADTSARKPVDWEKIEAEYRAGQLSVREIARQHGGITETAIRKRAKAGSWERDLSEKVRERARIKLVRDLGSQDSSQEQRARTEAETIETAAERQIQALREHRQDIGRGRHLTMRLLDELDATTAHLGELTQMIEDDTEGEKSPKRRDAMYKAVSLPARATVVKDLSAAAKNWIALERQALGVDYGGEGGQGGEEASVVKVYIPSNNRG